MSTGALYERRKKFFHMDTTGTYVIKEGPTYLHSIVGASSTTTLTIYDNTEASGDIVGLIAQGAIGPARSFQYDILLKNGLTIDLNVGSVTSFIVIYS